MTFENLPNIDEITISYRFFVNDFERGIVFLHEKDGEWYIIIQKIVAYKKKKIQEKRPIRCDGYSEEAIKNAISCRYPKKTVKLVPLSKLIKTKKDAGG